MGFGLTRFDVPVMDKYFEMNFFSVPRLDILDEIEMTAGRRISLNILAKTNIGIEKTQESGLEAIRLYREGKMEELEKYWNCKFYLHNTPHAAAAFLGKLFGKKYVHESTKIPIIIR